MSALLACRFVTTVTSARICRLQRVYPTVLRPFSLATLLLWGGDRQSGGSNFNRSRPYANNDFGRGHSDRNDRGEHNNSMRGGSSSFFDKSSDKGNRGGDSASSFSSGGAPMELTSVPEIMWRDVPDLSPKIQEALAKVFKYEKCTPVQSSVFSHLPLKHDLLVQAKTGTGKTLAFLVPALETCKNLFDNHGKKVSILIITPTRELATQIADEANKLLHFENLGVKCFVGGESKSVQIRSLDRGRCDIVVGTPGRLIDIIESVEGFQARLSGIKVLILDEADRMLEIGFREPISHIISYIPTKRRSLLFSATYPQDVKSLSSVALRPDFKIVNTISPGDAKTIETVKQRYIVAPLADHAKLLHSILLRAQQSVTSDRPFKAIVFFPTTMMTQLYAELFKFAKISVFELHSKKSQPKRTQTAELFRHRKSAILFTSDVSARGVDYPDVNIVIQMGVPDNKDQYVHRIGRTGRAGKEGEALSILAPFESYFLEQLKGLPLEQAPLSNGCPEVNVTHNYEHDIIKSDKIIKRAASFADKRIARECIIGTLGFYSGKVDEIRRAGLTPKTILDEFAAFSEVLDVDMPTLSSRLGPIFDKAPIRPSQRRSDSSFRSQSDRGNSFSRGFGGRGMGGGNRGGDRFSFNDRNDDMGGRSQGGDRYGSEERNFGSRERYASR